MSLFLCLFLSSLLQLIHVAESQAVACSQPLDRGNDHCAKAHKSIKYFYDSSLETCFPYQFEGCEGGPNKFDTEDQCYQRCRPADKGNCGANSKPLGSCTALEKKCPEGSKCIVMAFGIGLCCDSKIQEDWLADREPKCPSNSKLATVQQWYGDTTLLGRNCSHKFCPSGSKCLSGKWFSYCCKSQKSKSAF